MSEPSKCCNSVVYDMQGNCQVCIMLNNVWLCSFCGLLGKSDIPYKHTLDNPEWRSRMNTVQVNHA